MIFGIPPQNIFLCSTVPQRLTLDLWFILAITLWTKGKYEILTLWDQIYSLKLSVCTFQKSCVSFLQLLIGFECGIVVLWDLKSKKADYRYNHDEVRQMLL